MVRCCGMHGWTRPVFMQGSACLPVPALALASGADFVSLENAVPLCCPVDQVPIKHQVLTAAYGRLTVQCWELSTVLLEQEKRQVGGQLGACLAAHLAAEAGGIAHLPLARPS